MKTVYVVNEADNFHSLNSFRLVGVATTKNKAIKLVKEALKDSPDKLKLTEKDIEQLTSQNQTQQSRFDWEYNLKELKINTLQ
jgi:rRNA maturation endonuclease Nob1